jgi:hypothetical protein
MSEIKGIILTLKLSHIGDLPRWIREIQSNHFLKTKNILLYIDHENKLSNHRYRRKELGVQRLIWGTLDIELEKIQDFIKYCDRDFLKEISEKMDRRKQARDELKKLHQEAIRCLDISVGAYDAVIMEIQERIRECHDLL